MSLERLDATQVCTWAPPLPQRAFPLLGYGSTTEDMPGAGLASDGRRYSWLTIDTTQWAAAEGFHVAPMQAGEKIQAWTAYDGTKGFAYPPAFDSGSAEWDGSVNDLSTGGSPDLFNVSAVMIGGPAATSYPASVASAISQFSSTSTQIHTTVEALYNASNGSLLKSMIESTNVIKLWSDAVNSMSQALKANGSNWATSDWGNAIKTLSTAYQAGTNAQSIISGHNSGVATSFGTANTSITNAISAAQTAYDGSTGQGTNRDGVAAGYVPLYVLRDPVVATVVSVEPVTNTSWNVYVSPYLNRTFTPGQDGIVTIPEPYDPRWLGQIGHVSAIDYTYSIPGGPDQFTCLLEVEPWVRDVALNPGRIVTLHRGGSCIWEGQAVEPTNQTTGWQITANGVGTYGTNFGAWWEIGVPWNQTTATAWTPDSAIDFAIARGLRWRNYGVGKPAGIYLGPVQDPGSITVTDFMNLLCTGGTLTWELVQPAGAASFPPAPWEVRVYPLPQDISGNPLAAGPKQQQGTSDPYQDGKWHRVDSLTAYARRPPDLYLINTNPIPRTITADYNTVIVFYEVTADTTATSTTKATSATYATTFADAPGSVAIHGRMEYYLDVTNAGPMSRTAAQNIGKNVLNKYIRANFSNPFSVMPGQLVNIGGAPVDLGCNWNGAMCTVQVIGPAMGGEVGFAPMTFQIGTYEYDDDSQTATITPYQNANTDISSVVAALYPGKFA